MDLAKAQVDMAFCRARKRHPADSVQSHLVFCAGGTANAGRSHKVRSWAELCLAHARLAGDEAALALFRQRHADNMLRAIRRVVSTNDAEDIHQRVLIKLLTGERHALRRYRGLGSMRAWLGVVCANEALDWLRQNKKHRLTDTLVEEVLRCEIRNEHLPLPAATARIKAGLQIFLRDLPAIEREIVGYYAAGLTTIDVGE